MLSPVGIMMKCLRPLLLLPLCAISIAVSAQDVILTKGGSEIIGKVVHVGTDTVLYRHFSDATAPAHAMLREEVAQVRLMYLNNPMVLAPETGYDPEAVSLLERQELVLQAKQDAKDYYKPKGVFWTTMGSTILNPLAGFATGSLISAVPPDVEANYNPNRHLLKDPIYRNAYKEQAHRRKVGKVAAGFGVGAAVVSVLYVLVSNVGGIY